MRRNLLIVVLVSVSCTSMFAQKFTVHGGLSVSDVLFYIDTASIDPNKKAGIFFGLESEFKLTENLFIAVGTDFLQKGFSVRADEYIPAKFSTTINYINIPVALRYKFDLEDLLMTFESGPYIGFGISARTKTGVQIEKLYFGKEEGELGYFDFGFTLGFGFEVDIVRFGINYCNGLNNISSSLMETLKTRCLVVSFGITF